MIGLTLALALPLPACTDSRSEARRELERFHQAMQRHAEDFGAFPETLDPALPLSRSNLPFAPKGEARVRFLGSTDQGYAATARHGIWICGLQSRSGGSQINCTPTGSGEEDTSDGSARADSLTGELLTPATADSLRSETAPET